MAFPEGFPRGIESGCLSDVSVSAMTVAYDTRTINSQQGCGWVVYTWLYVFVEHRATEEESLVLRNK